MGQKHNRRRNRPRPRHRYPLQQHQQQAQLQPATRDNVLYYSNVAANYNHSYHNRSPSSSSSITSLSSPASSASLMTTPLLGPAMLPHAQPWHHRYMPWQDQDKMNYIQEQSCQPIKAAATLEEEQCRLFGGEPGDDPALCYRMLEYFGGLDFILNT